MTEPHEQDHDPWRRPAEMNVPAPEADEQARATPQPGIWVAADRDTPIGSWWDACGTPEALRDRIGEGAVFDTVDFGSFEVEQYDDPEVISAVANGIREHGYAFAAWAQLHDADPDMLALFREHYLAHYDSLEEFGIELVGSAWREIRRALPERLAPYVQIDYRAIADDELHGTSVIALPDEAGGFWLFGGPDWQPGSGAATPNQPGWAPDVGEP